MPQTYWRVLKKRLKDKENEAVTSCNALKLLTKDGKNKLTDCLDTKGVLRLVQSILSPKAVASTVWERTARRNS